jgi:tetratricopeptide (TPR) repeat protein
MSGNIHSGGLAVCSKCGWFESQSQAKARIKAENQTITIMIAFAVSLLLVSAHMVSWGGHAFSIPGLKIAQWTGLLSAGGYEELAQDCIDLNKYSCARTAYIESFQINRSPEPLAKLARLQVRMQETQAGMATFGTYFKNGGKDGEAALLYGQLLEQAGQDAEAEKMLELSIASRSNMLPIAATGAIVRIMMKQGRYDEARTRIETFQASAGNAKGYLNTELAQIEQAIKMYKPSAKAQARR